MGQLVVIAGNLGSGKTTLARLLSERFEATVFGEIPAEYPYLEDMYADMKRWCFNNQLSFMVKKAEEHLEIQAGTKLGIQDRGMAETHEVFSQAFLKLGMLSQRDYTMLHRTHSLLQPRLEPADLVIFLYAPVPFLHARILQRDRSTEVAVWPPLLEELNRQYERWYDALATKHIGLDMTGIDFVARREDLESVYSKVQTIVADPAPSSSRFTP